MGRSFLVFLLTLISTVEVIGYVSRVLSRPDVELRPKYMAQTVTLTMAPSLLMAGIYSLPAKYAVIFGRKTSPLRPMWYTYLFVSADVFAILLQGAGGGLAASADAGSSGLQTGTNIMIGGLVIQVVAMVFFFCVGVLFVLRVRKQKAIYASDRTSLLDGEDGFDPRYQDIRNRKMFIPLVYAIFVCFIFVFIRSVFRTVELAQGWCNELMHTEIYFLILETLMIALAMIPITIIHPGMAFSKLRIKMHEKNSEVEEEIDLNDSYVRN